MKHSTKKELLHILIASIIFVAFILLLIFISRIILDMDDINHLYDINRQEVARNLEEAGIIP